MRRPSAKTWLRLALTPILVWAIYLLKANVWMKLYPAVMVAIAFFGFAASLFRTPLVETFARKMGETLDGRAVAYCRNVTRVWTAFLFLHLGVTLATVWMSDRVWAFYNGFLAYALMGALFVGEWLVRRRVKRRG